MTDNTTNTDSPDQPNTTREQASDITPRQQLNEILQASEGDDAHNEAHRRTHRYTTEPQVLQADNPLMQRFQIALKTHLTNQNKKLQEEIIGLKLFLKDDTKAYQDHIEIRDLEQNMIFRQNVILEKEKEETEKLIKNREEVEESLKEKSSLCKETANSCTDNLNKEHELRLEKESLASLITQFLEWEESQNSEITIAQRISEKNKSNKNLHTRDKIYQDMLLVSLTSEVLKLTAKFSELEKNTRQKQSEVELLAQSVADGNADLEALERENKRLIQIWNHVILQIQQRDRIMVDVKTQLQMAQEQYTRLICQVESYKRSSGAEVKRNETLTQTLVRLEGDIDLLERHNAAEDDKQRKLRENLVQIANMVELTQRDLTNITSSSKEKEVKLQSVQNELDKLLQLKYQLEEELVTNLHKQLVFSKVERQRTQLISSLRNTARKLESQLASAQNELARVLLLIEQENKYLKEQQLVIEQEKIDDLMRERELKESEAGLKRLETMINRKQGQADNINIRLSEISRKTQGIDLTPDELQIVFLEKNLAETTNNIEELHSSWMREQSRIVVLTQQRNTLLNQLNVFNKQTMVMKQKNIKIEFEIDNHKKEEINMSHQTRALEKKLTNLNLQCSERKDYKENLDNLNLFAQNQLMCDLKDAEVKALTLQEDMCLIEIEKEEMRGQIVEAQRDFLAWDRKLQMATEVKASIDKAKAEGGEIAVMKSEIHRMEVRYAQLQKVQEKLAHDMEMCISRRDGIVDLAQAREKRSTKRAMYTRQQFLKKLDDLQTKIKQTNSELKSVEKSFSSSEKQLRALTEKEYLKKNQLSELQSAVSQMQAQLAEGQLHRQKNLELLVRKQKKARQYGELKAGRYGLLFRQESAMELETQKQKTINSDLVSIVESLITDFPVLVTPVTQILNTLHSPAA